MEQTQDRDDLYVEYITLLNILGRHEEALERTLGRQFHPWEGGEGKIPKQYVTALLQLAKEHNARGEYARAEELLRQAAGSIADTRNKLTDEQLFASPRFSAYLTDIAEGATKRYKRSSKVRTCWDLSENAGIAVTDNRIIHLNAGNFLTRSFPTRSLRADSLIGLVGHECGHILFSDFTMLELYFQSLEKGRFYPKEPEAVTTALEKNLQDIKDCLSKKDEAAIKALSDISHSLVNIMEDVYIESRICDEFAGSFKTGILLNNLRFAEEMNTVQDEVNRQHHEVFIILNLLIQYAKAGDINNLGGYKGPYLNVVYDCIPLIDDAVYDDDAKTRFDAANQLLLLLWPYMKSFIEQIREDRSAAGCL